MAPLLVKQTGTLLHRQLFLLLKQQIARGELQNGDRLPTQEELCVRYNVSRITVRRALADLQAEGAIRNEQGVGAFVIAPATPKKTATTLSFIDGLRKSVAETDVQLLSIEVLRCPPPIGAVLALGTGEEALHIVRIRSRRSTPVMLLDAWLPKRFEPILTENTLTKRPLFNLVTNEGKDVGKVIQEVNAEVADQRTASLLGIDLDSAVLRIERLVHNRKQVPIQFLTIRSSPIHSRLLMEIAGRDVNTLSAGHLAHDI